MAKTPEAAFLEEARERGKQNAFSPIDEIAERKNCKRMIVIGLDGKPTERIRLSVNDPAHREELILLHYLRHHANAFGSLPIGVNIWDRDNPWDFDVELNDERRFFVEITAVGDSKFQFEREKREEKLANESMKPKIRLGDLRKLHKMFSLYGVDDLIKRYAKEPAAMTVTNPLHSDPSKRLIHGQILRPDARLADKIVAAVNLKAAKKHDGKEKTVLILDYRTNFPTKEGLLEAMAELPDYFAASPFPEIWLYHGYFSDDDGNNAEFSFAPLKLPEAQARRFEQLAVERGVDEHGRIVW
ncbi:hypothetical protein [Sphingopyxis granuli]|uniref:hypothetical protein n=1 Tax=Sphingopyxis granuli TaxID=267128 RepID=UPI00301DF01B